MAIAWISTISAARCGLDARNLDSRGAARGKRRLILNDISLSIAPREFVALVGGSGTGKSTLMNALSGYVQASGGHVFVNGDDYYRNFDAYRTVLATCRRMTSFIARCPVDRALGYAAQLRLPPTPRAPRSPSGSQVLEDVEMAPHRDTLVDNLSAASASASASALSCWPTRRSSSLMSRLGAGSWFGKKDDVHAATPGR